MQYVLMDEIELMMDIGLLAIARIIGYKTDCFSTVLIERLILLK